MGAARGARHGTHARWLLRLLDPTVVFACSQRQARPPRRHDRSCTIGCWNAGLLSPFTFFVLACFADTMLEGCEWVVEFDPGHVACTGESLFLPMKKGIYGQADVFVV